MKKLIILSLILMFAYSNTNAQFKMDASSGNIAIATTPSPSTNTKFSVSFAPSSTATYQYAITGSNSLLTNKKNIGLYGNAYNSTALNGGRAIGVYGMAGNSTTGYNYGIYGILGGSQNGTGVYGGLAEYSDEIEGRYAGYFAGNVNINGGLYLYEVLYASDKRLKKDIVPISNSIYEKISQLNAVEYKYKTKKELITDGIITVSDTSQVEESSSSDVNFDKVHFGYIAQDVQNIFPELVYEKENGLLGIDYIGLIPLMFEAFKEQQKSIETQASTITNLQKQVDNCCSSETKNTTTDVLNNTSKANVTAFLYQNTPNPFSKETLIKYFIPSDAQSAAIYVYNMQGTQLKKIDIDSKGDSSITIQGSELKAGMYMYTLIIDGKEIDTKKMILTE